MKNSLAFVIFKGKKNQHFFNYFEKINIFSIILRQLEKWENYKKISYQKALVVL
jgi:hypothetical protein